MGTATSKNQRHRSATLKLEATSHSAKHLSQRKKKLIYGLKKAPSKPSSSFRGSMSRIFTSNVAPQTDPSNQIAVSTGATISISSRPSKESVSPVSIQAEKTLGSAAEIAFPEDRHSKESLLSAMMRVAPISTFFRRSVDTLDQCTSVGIKEQDILSLRHKSDIPRHGSR